MSAREVTRRKRRGARARRQLSEGNRTPMSDKKPAAVITGGTGGLGQAVSLAFLDAGWDVMVTFVEEEQFQELERKADAKASSLRGICADLTRADEVERLAQETRREFGAIEALVNLVGGFAGGFPVTQTPEAVWDHMMRLNLKTCFLTVRALAPLVVENGGGAIVTVGSRGAVETPPGLAAYAVSKAGVVALTKALAEELRRDRVRVNCVLPSIIDTPANRSAMPDADFSRWVRPEALARTILFLVSEEAAPISGACIPVYGDS
ncbi:MAG: short-chain dehydrogenase [Armatimonadota bacterium]|nr:MAG: short-chain dehydrogenase [Armatimonadota bacterium]